MRLRPGEWIRATVSVGEAIERVAKSVVLPRARAEVRAYVATLLAKRALGRGLDSRVRIGVFFVRMEFAFGFVLLFLVIRSDAIEARGVVVLIRGRDAVAALGDLLPAPRRAFAELLHPELLELLLEGTVGAPGLAAFGLGRGLILPVPLGLFHSGASVGTHPRPCARTTAASLRAPRSPGWRFFPSRKGTRARGLCCAGGSPSIRLPPLDSISWSSGPGRSGDDARDA